MIVLKDFLNIINMQVRYRVTDRFTKQSVKVSSKEVLNRKIYMVFQYEDGTLNICLY